MRGALHRFTRSGTAWVVATAVLVVAVVLTVIGVNSGHSPGVDTLNACLSHKHFLVAKKHRSDRVVIDTIKDRGTGLLVGEFAVFPSSRAESTFRFASTIGPPGGTGVANGRMVLYTGAPFGRDTNAILACSSPEFPGP